MDEEMLKLIIANLPNFVGLIYMAYSLEVRAKACESRYEELVKRVLDEEYNEEAD